jgi:YVTN family beta-propeller protein
MKIPANKKDAGVSEVIGAVLVFAIFISIFTTVSSYYIPSTQSSAETNYQSQSMAAMSDLNSAISGTQYTSGSVINQYIPLGIQGGILSPSEQTSVTYSDSGMSGSLSYGIGESFSYLSQHPTSAILNKLLGTFPNENFLLPDAAVYYQPTNTVYVAGYSTHDLVGFRATSGTLTGYFYAGQDPKFIALDGNSLVVADNYTVTAKSGTTGPNFYYMPISIISTSTNSVTQIIEIKNPNDVQFDVTALTVLNQDIYVAYHYLDLKNGAITNNLTEFQLQGGSYVRIANVNPGSIITSLTYDSASNAIIGLEQPSNGFFAGNPSYLVFNPNTLSSYSVSLNFSYFYNNYCYNSLNKSVSKSTLLSYNDELKLAGKGSPEVILNSALIGLNGIIYFGYNITNQSLIYSSGSTNLIYPSSGIAGSIFSTISTATSLVSNCQFYTNSSDRYILNPSCIAQDTSLTSEIALGSSVTTYSSGSSSPPTEDIVFNAVSSGTAFNILCSGTSVSKVAGNIVFAAKGIGSQPSYFITNSNLNVETAIVLNSQSLVTATQTIRDDFFNGPYSGVYDPVSNLVYFTDYNTGSVSIVSPITDALVGSVSLGPGSFPTNLTVNQNNGTVYVVESHQNAIALISGTYLLSTIKLGTSLLPVIPYGISYNPSTNTVYVSGEKSSSFVILNISATACTEVGTPTLGTPSGVFLDSATNESYAIMKNSGSYYLYSINNVFAGQSLSGLTTKYPADGTFDSYNGYLYVTNGGTTGYVYIYIPGSTTTSFSPYAKIPRLAVGGYPTGSVFDPANNLLYVANSVTNNITIIDTTNNTYFSTIWTGSGPQHPLFDSENGYIYIPDFTFNKVSVIDGGFTILNGRIGIVQSGNAEIGGSIYTTGLTSFVSPVSFVSEGGALIENFTNNNQTKVLSGLPLSILNSNGNIYLSYASSYLTLPSGSSDATASSLSPTDLKMQITSETNNTFLRGSQFLISDVYGNQYPAEVTNVFLEYFNLSLNTPFASSLNNNLYNQYSGQNSADAPAAWSFSGLPFTVTLNGNILSISLNHSIQVSFISIVSYNIGLLGV